MTEPQTTSAATRNNRKILAPVAMVFIVTNGLILAMKQRLISWGFDITVLLVGNLLLVLLSLLTYYLHSRAMRASRSTEFLRYFYTAFLLKFFLVIAAVAAYALTAHPVNKPAVVTCMALYLVYTFLETRLLLKAGKQKNG